MNNSQRQSQLWVKPLEKLKKAACLGCSVLAFFLVYVGLADAAPYEARVTLAITIGAIVLWIFEPIPFSMTAIMVLILLPLTKAVTINQALSGFSSPAVFMIVAGMMMARGVEQTPLGVRAAYLILYWMGDKRGGVLWGLVLISQVLAFFIPATAVRTTMILPTVFSIFAIMGLKQGDVQGKQLMMGVAYGANISGTAILPAAVGNMITIDLINLYLHRHITFFDWLLLSLPMWLILIPLCWWVLYKCFPVTQKPQADFKIKMKEKLVELGPIQSKEKRLMFILAVVCVLWSLEGFHGLAPVIPALIGVIFMAWPGIEIANWHKLVDIRFDSFILVAVTLSLGHALYDSGAVSVISTWLDNGWTISLFSNPTLAVLTVAVLVQIIHKLASNVSTAVVATIPIVLALASHVTNAPVLLLAFIAGLTCLFGFMVAVETIPNVLAVQTGWVTQKDFIKPGFWMTLISLALTYLMAFTWWQWIGYIW